jgi:hypothetical protein
MDRRPRIVMECLRHLPQCHVRQAHGCTLHGAWGPSCAFVRSSMLPAAAAACSPLLGSSPGALHLSTHAEWLGEGGRHSQRWRGA